MVRKRGRKSIALFPLASHKCCPPQLLMAQEYIVNFQRDYIFKAWKYRFKHLLWNQTKVHAFKTKSYYFFNTKQYPQKIDIIASMHNTINNTHIHYTSIQYPFNSDPLLSPLKIKPLTVHSWFQRLLFTSCLIHCTKIQIFFLYKRHIFKHITNMIFISLKLNLTVFWLSYLKENVVHVSYKCVDVLLFEHFPL